MIKEKQLSVRIKSVLLGVCPAFVFTGRGASLWHGCDCKAQRGGPCDCVWHTTSTCIAGTWPQLTFVDEYHKERNKAAMVELAKAKAAIAKAKSPQT